MVVLTTISRQERQAEAIVTLLETFQPRSALKPYLMQFKKIVKDLESDPKMPGVVLPSSSSGAPLYKQSRDDEEEKYEDCIQIAPVCDTSDANGSSRHSRSGFGTKSFQKLRTSLSVNSITSQVTPRQQRDDAELLLYPVSPARRHRNEDLAPDNPLTSPRSTVSRDSYQSQSYSQASASRCANRYYDTSRFLAGANVQGMHSNRTKPIREVFETTFILARILEFDGSLAAYHKNYDLIEGYMIPQRKQRSQSRFRRRPGSTQLAFVNQKFYSMIIGLDGLEAWKEEARVEIETRKRIARDIMRSSNSSRSRGPSPLAKVFAIVIRNDAIEFEYLLSKHVASIQQGTSMNNDNGSDVFGMALNEYVKGDGRRVGASRTMGLPQGHPFLKCCSCWNAKESDYTTLLAELAYNAVVCSAIDVLTVLSTRHNTLYSTSFGATGNQTLLGELVSYACKQSCCLEEFCQGIRTLMANQRFDERDLHAFQPGSHGNSLHLAAAKGDRELVYALLDIGCDPNMRCDERAFPEESYSSHSSRHYRSNSNSGGEKLWFPEDWARIRGHTKIVRLLERRRRQLQLQHQHQQSVLQAAPSEVSKYSIDSASYRRADSMADFDSDSSCTSDYSDRSDVYDSEEEGTETTGFGDEDSTEFENDDTDDDTARIETVYTASSYVYTSDDRYRSPRRRAM